MKNTLFTQWAIIHRPTKYYLAEFPYKHGRQRRRGYTFEDPKDPKEARPRLFNTEGGAKRALTAWLKGKHFGEQEDGYTIGVSYIKQIETRLRSQMAIVPVHIIAEEPDMYFD